MCENGNNISALGGRTHILQLVIRLILVNTMLINDQVQESQSFLKLIVAQLLKQLPEILCNAKVYFRVHNIPILAR
jgi:hypothetical protein